MATLLIIDNLKLRQHEGSMASCKVQSYRLVDSWFAQESPNTGGSG